MAAGSAAPPPPPLSSGGPVSHFGNLTLEHTLEDLSARFIVNLPAEELESMDRVCFQIEQAHWFYEDFVRPNAENLSLLPSFSLKHFSLLMFRTCPLLEDYVSNHAQIWASFMTYKVRVPVCGAILISEFWDKVLLVKGWQKNAAWSFPRGKINKDEAESMCAVREVLEETGYDIRPNFDPRQLLYRGENDPRSEDEEAAERHPYYIELVIKEQKIRLYFIPGVVEDTYFETRTRKEISKIDWFKVSDLPTWGKDRKAKKAAVEDKKNAAKFYMVTPFISHLKLWIDRNKPKNLRKRQPSFAASQLHSPPPHVPHPLNHSSSLPVFESDLEPQSSSSDGEFTNDEEEEQRRQLAEFTTTEEGTQALKAFFFGGDPDPDPDLNNEAFTSPAMTEPLELPQPIPDDTHPTSSSGQTPPQIAYKRQNSFVQPRPKATLDQTNKLLALLSNANPVPSPPPQKISRKKSHTFVVGGTAELGTGPQEGGSLMAALDEMVIRQRGNIGVGGGLMAPTSTVSTSSSPAQSILFANSAPPREAEGFGYTHVATEAERSDSERLEKREALMRALFSVVAQPTSARDLTPTPSPSSSPPSSNVIHQTTETVPNNILSLFKGPRRLSTPTQHDIEGQRRQEWRTSPSPELKTALNDLRNASGHTANYAPTVSSSGSSMAPVDPGRDLLSLLRGGGGSVSDGERRQPTISPNVAPQQIPIPTSIAYSTPARPQQATRSQQQQQQATAPYTTPGFPAYHQGPAQMLSPTGQQQPYSSPGGAYSHPSSVSAAPSQQQQHSQSYPSFASPPLLAYPQQPHQNQNFMGMHPHGPPSQLQGYPPPSFPGFPNSPHQPPMAPPPANAQYPPQQQQQQPQYPHQMFGPRPLPPQSYSQGQQAPPPASQHHQQQLQQPRLPLPLPPSNGSSNVGYPSNEPRASWNSPPPPPPPQAGKKQMQSGALLSLLNGKL